MDIAGGSGSQPSPPSPSDPTRVPPTYDPTWTPPSEGRAAPHGDDSDKTQESTRLLDTTIQVDNGNVSGRVLCNTQFSLILLEIESIYPIPKLCRGRVQ